MKIRNKMFLAYACAFFLVFSVVGIVIYTLVTKIIQESIEGELSRTTEMIQNMIHTTADVSIKNYMRAVAEKNFEEAEQLYRQVRRGRITEEEAKRRARESFLSQTIGTTGRIYCLDSNGIMVLNHKYSLLDVDLSNLPFVKEQIRRKNGYIEYDWKEPFEKDVRPKAVFMRYFEPWDWIISVSSYRNEFAELVNVEDLNKRMFAMGLGKSGYPFVLDYDGNMLLHPSLEGKHYDEFADSKLTAIARRIVEEKKGHFEYLWKNPGETEFKEKVVYFMDIPEMGWVVASSSYYEDFHAPLNTIKLIFIGSLLLSLLLMVPVSMGIGSLITRPLSELQADLVRAADGDLSVRMRKYSSDELGIMAEYFNSFMETLEEYSRSRESEIAVRKDTEQKLIAMDKAKTLFLAAASHELRTPLTSILGFLKLMEKRFQNQFRPHLVGLKDGEVQTETFARNLSIVRIEAERLGRLVNDLLDMSKIEAGKMEWRDQPFSVSEIIDRAANSISVRANNSSKLDFVVIKPEEDVCVTVDSDRLHQVLINLLDNAFKYTESGSVSLTAAVAGKVCEFSVRDTGRGIPEEDREKIFDIFYQVQDVNKRSSQVFGTGLGLAICRRIVEHYDGELMAQPAINGGSCFTFSVLLSESENVDH
ncbi:cache domain-containing protein [uncultured Pseudodesulfovibrio sp.]|uniref:cache domain-containing protein n=1 Tax=uncultured Pseudodesulfovibrio sp. TaxID=2035858 RepID=UPI0029C98D4F|nr:cache domain-containing protein [uncultured Pseudodesulfovibrio sp.]